MSGAQLTLVSGTIQSPTGATRTARHAAGREDAAGRASRADLMRMISRRRNAKRRRGGGKNEGGMHAIPSNRTRNQVAMARRKETVV